MTTARTNPTPESWACIDCGINTAPGHPTRRQLEAAFCAVGNGGESVPLMFDEKCEVYAVKHPVWEAAGMAPLDGCLCIGCLETRIGRTLKPKDFDKKHPFYSLPGTDRLEGRRTGGDFVFRRNGKLSKFVDGVKVAKLVGEEWVPVTEAKPVSRAA
jgi:hypothetical protein